MPTLASVAVRALERALKELKGLVLDASLGLQQPNENAGPAKVWQPACRSTPLPRLRI